MKRTIVFLAIVLVTIAWSAPSAHPAPVDGRDPRLDPMVDAAFAAAYNLEHGEAARLARAAVALAPEDPRSHRALATVLWLELLFRQGTLTVDYHLAGLFRSTRARPAAPGGLDTEIKQALARAAALSDARVRRAPSSVDARYEYGAVRALEASYAATVEGSTKSAFGAARRAYDAHERVLEIQPAHASASVIVGSYRYLVSGFALPGRLVAYLAGFGGGKERGIAMLEAARRDPIAGIDAATTLVLIYTREGRHVDAFDAARELERRFPRNRLFSLEVGAAAVRAGRMEDAEIALTRGLAAFASDARPKMPGELALLRYKRGLARLSRNRVDEAAADFRAALDASPTGWIEGRVRLEMGHLASIRGANQAATVEYGKAQETCSLIDDQGCVAEASRRLRAARNPVE